MTETSSRAVWRSIMNFERPSRMPLFSIEGVPHETADRWRSEGLPPGTDVNAYLGIDQVEWLHADFYPLPRFSPVEIEDGEEYRIEINMQGIKTQVSKSHPELVYQLLEFPVNSRSDWERMKERYDPADIRRLPLEWGDPDLPSYYDACTNPVGLLVHPFFFRLGLYSMGLVPFLKAFYDDPDLIHDMFAYWAAFTRELTGKILEVVKPDFVVIAEDMAHKTAPHISPEMYREFWFPHQTEVMTQFKDAGVEIVSFWNSGYLIPLLPTLIEAGFNCMWPLEDVAGMKAPEIRERFGESMRMVGNISKESLIAGGDTLKREIYEKVPPLIEAGGFIPAVDDQVPLEVSFDNYRYYMDLLRQVGREAGL